jgi:hypothetical protein
MMNAVATRELAEGPGPGVRPTRWYGCDQGQQNVESTAKPREDHADEVVTVCRTG